MIERPATVLSRSNAKTIKGEEEGWLTAILSFASGNRSGYEVCPKRTDGCFKDCIYQAGNGKFDNVMKARVDRTRFFFEERNWFMSVLVNDIRRFRASAARQGMQLCVRLNGFSDIFSLPKAICPQFPDVEFYDYTKIPTTALASKGMPNYSVTFSRSEENDAQCLRLLDLGFNVAVVFNCELPDKWNNYAVINGDVNDLRFLDPSPVDGKGWVIGLTVKGDGARRHASSNPFFVQHDDAANRYKVKED